MFGFAIGRNHFLIPGLLMGRRFPSRSVTMNKEIKSYFSSSDLLSVARKICHMFSYDLKQPKQQQRKITSTWRIVSIHSRLS
jgi:hypothetical protein